MADTTPEQKLDGLNEDLLKASEECKTEQEIPKKVNSKQISEDQNIPLGARVMESGFVMSVVA